MQELEQELQAERFAVERVVEDLRSVDRARIGTDLHPRLDTIAEEQLRHRHWPDGDLP